MKKSTLALVVMGIVASASVQAAEIYNKDGNKLDVYGKVKAMHYMSDNASKDGDQSYIRFGFKGETQINDQLTGYGRWEAEFAGNKAESDTAQQKTRLAFAGLKYKDLGSFDYGRNLGALYDVEAWTDMFPEFGGDSSAQTDNFMTKRASGLATYRNTDFFGVIDGLNLTLQYQGKNENRDVKKQNGDGFGTSLTYDFGGSDFAISGAYTNSDRTNEQNLQSRGTGKRAEAWATGLKYDANNIYLATFYSETRKMTPITGALPIRHRTLKRSLNTSLTLVCVHRWVMSYRKGKILKVSVMKIWSIISTSVLRIISTKICQRLLIIKSTNWIAITN